MEQDEHTTAPAPLLRDVLPQLSAELVTLLKEEGERDLALCAHDLRPLADCGCGDDFCRSFRTAPHPPGRATATWRCSRPAGT
ncbi:hypothetical protein ACFVJ8_01250 [Streptomyces yangpuensis]|uniref:hypothetical protein n=1 Tax=Streptomyces yangpuensis TaxID=1648182 RepID=UPI00363C4119